MYLKAPATILPRPVCDRLVPSVSRPSSSWVSVCLCRVSIEGVCLYVTSYVCRSVCLREQTVVVRGLCVSMQGIYRRRLSVCYIIYLSVCLCTYVHLVNVHRMQHVIVLYSLSSSPSIALRCTNSAVVREYDWLSIAQPWVYSSLYA